MSINCRASHDLTMPFQRCCFFLLQYLSDVLEILEQEVSLWRKLYLIYSFFFIRKVVAHVVPFMLYCVVIPLSVLIPEVTVPVWGVVYIPTTITLLYAIRSPRFVSSKTLALNRLSKMFLTTVLLSVLSISYHSGSFLRM